MGRRRKPQSLKSSCIVNICRNMAKRWCADYHQNFHDQGTFLHILGPFECLTPSLIQELIYCLDEMRKMKPYFLNVLIDARMTSLDLSVCRKAANKDSVMNLIAVRCNRLTQLNITNCHQVSSKALSEMIGALPHLISLDLSYTKCKDEVLVQIGNTCENIRELNIKGCPVTDSGLMSLCLSFDETKPKAKKLMRLKLGLNFNRITRKGLEVVLTSCPNLQYLEYPDVCDVLYKMAANGSTDKLALRTIHMSQMQDFDYSTAEAIRVSCDMCPNLTEAYMHRGLTDEGMRYLADVQNLSVLHVANADLEDISFEIGILTTLKVRGHNLVELDVNDVNYLDIGLIGKYCPELKKFSCLLAGFETGVFPMDTEPTPNNLVAFTKLKELKILIYTEENNFPAQFLRLLLANARDIHQIHLFKIQSLDGELLDDILKVNPMEQLERLTLEFCNNIGLDVIYEFCEAKNNLAILTLKGCREITRIDREQLEMLVEEDNLDMIVEWI